MCVPPVLCDPLRLTAAITRDTRAGYATVENEYVVDLRAELIWLSIGNDRRQETTEVRCFQLGLP